MTIYPDLVIVDQANKNTKISLIQREQIMAFMRFQSIPSFIIHPPAWISKYSISHSSIAEISKFRIIYLNLHAQISKSLIYHPFIYTNLKALQKLLSIYLVNHKVLYPVINISTQILKNYILYHSSMLAQILKHLVLYYLFIYMDLEAIYLLTFIHLHISESTLSYIIHPLAQLLMYSILHRPSTYTNLKVLYPLLSIHLRVLHKYLKSLHQSSFIHPFRQILKHFILLSYLHLHRSQITPFSVIHLLWQISKYSILYYSSSCINFKMLHHLSFIYLHKS